MGGLADVLRVFGGALTGLFSLKLFHAALIGSAYRVQSSIKDYVANSVEPVGFGANSFVTNFQSESSVSNIELIGRTQSPAIDGAVIDIASDEPSTALPRHVAKSALGPLQTEINLLDDSGNIIKRP